MRRGLSRTLYKREQMKSKIKNDLILVGVILLLSVISFGIFKALLKPGNSVAVLVNGEEKYRFSINEDLEEFIVTDGENSNTIVIKDGKVRVSHASCPDKICASHAPIKNEGEAIVCLPNKVVITVTK